MSELSIQQISPNGAALSAENYQTFEMAKANDTILGGDDIAQIRTYAAYVRAQAQVIHKTIAATSSIDDVVTVKEEMTESEQTLAKVGVFCDQRIGEILRELPKAKAGRKPNEVDTPTQLTKGEAEKQANIDHHTSIDLQKMAANPEVVQMVIDKAESEGRIVSRSQVLKAIKERDEARQEMQDVYFASENMEREVESLRKQLAKRPKPEVIEREVEVVREVESSESKHRIAELEHLERIHCDDNQKLRRQLEETRKKLDRAKVLLEEKGYEDNASWDISTLTSATNQYLRTYGGKVWAFDQFYRVDEVTQQEFVKAITNLAAFSQSIVQYISDNNKLEV